MQKLTTFVALLFLFGLTPKPAWTDVWLRCIGENSKFFPDQETGPPLIEIDGNEGRLRQSHGEILELECIRSQHDPGLVTCQGLSQAREGVVAANLFTIATDQDPPVALSSVFISHGSEILSPPAASRIGLSCDINGFPSHPHIKPEPRESNPNPTWRAD